MNANEIMTLGLGLTPPWQDISSELDLESNPTELKLELSAGRGAVYFNLLLIWQQSIKRKRRITKYVPEHCTPVAIPTDIHTIFNQTQVFSTRLD